MKKLIQIANLYVKTSDWKIFAVLKFCLISLGIMIGMNLPQKHRKGIFIGVAAIFVASYIPLMAKFFSLLNSHNDSE